mmetsp:Transcript_5937/g.7198  ORF Transcript_5937/g.7198 Transcript_5937/m.7198 type:complete len:241 (+) Transcript_5937:73-795(+)
MTEAVIVNGKEEEKQNQDENENFSCAVCYESLPVSGIAVLPCCYKSNSSTRFCRECIRIICSRGNGLGKCPICSKSIRVAETGEISVAENCEHCFCCSQLRVIADQRRKLCSACLLGRQYALRYECQGCSSFAIIRHPMWRYMEAPTSFTTDTWFCRRCRDQTRWRLHPYDLRRVPVDDRPASWGDQEAWFAAVRAERMQNIDRNRTSNYQSSVWTNVWSKALPILLLACVVSSFIGLLE